MPRINHFSKADTFTFRLDPGLKAAFVKLAEAQKKPAGEILRDFIRDLVETKLRSDFAKEARRQSRMIASAASGSGTDEAEVLRQLDRAFDELSRRKDW